MSDIDEQETRGNWPSAPTPKPSLPNEVVYTPGLSIGEWHKLPVALRNRWWTETQYCKVKPSDELLLALWKAAGKE